MSNMTMEMVRRTRGRDTGDDVLDGGGGIDTLDGGSGNDTYLFSRGNGQDVVNDRDWTVGNVDTVRMAEGIASSDVTVTRYQYNLYLSLNGGTDRMTLQNWFTGDDYKIERVSFADGTTWDAAELSNRVVVQTPTEAGDLISGREVRQALTVRIIHARPGVEDNAANSTWRIAA